ncbi:MAG TPA: amidinotransferase [Anaerolineae bacterium]|nr:amidinotransferase [Anaerolineae bacterium]HIP70332.1 amidinotransferase [Anaerolineae bacterium]
MNEKTTFNTAAYGGAGWRPRTLSLAEEMGSVWGSGGIRNEWGQLTAVLLHRPGPELTASDDPNEALMLEPLDLARAQAQHDAIAQAYRDAGVTVHYLDVEHASPNQMFMADLFFMTPEGTILARPASTVRAGEERQAARCLADLGIPIVRSVSGHGTFEGADAMWLDEETVILGRGLRTNDEGAAQVTAVLNQMGVKVIQVDLPYGTMHLMGMLRIVDRDLALAWPRRLAHRGVDALRERGYEVAFIPDAAEAEGGHALNVVTLAPRRVLMTVHAPATQAFYESLGIACQTVEIDELVKAAGAIGCLTGILARET